MYPLRRRIQGKVLTTGLSLVVLVMIICLVARAYQFLSINKPVASNILVVEGWIDEYSLSQAKELFKNNNYRVLITTGVPHSEGYLMGSNGVIVFPVPPTVMDSLPDSCRIILTHRGTRANEKFPHFRIMIDTIEIASSYSQKKVTDFICKTRITDSVKTINVQFDNDTYTSWRDRNFYFYSLSVNNYLLHPGNCNVTYYIGRKNKYIFKRQYAPDTAHDAYNYFTYAGIPDSVLIPISTTTQLKQSKTYSTAVDVKSYLEELYPEGIPPVTVVTRGMHARRTWISYKKAFSKDTAIGIISLPGNKLTSKNWWKSLKGWKSMVYEITGLMYASIAL